MMCCINKYGHEISQLNSKEKFYTLETIATEQLEKLEDWVADNYKKEKKTAVELHVSDQLNEMILDNIMHRKLLLHANKKFIDQIS